jgi:hypothetical protein
VLSCLWTNLSDEDIGVAEHASELLAKGGCFSKDGGAKVLKMIADSEAAENQGSTLQVGEDKGVLRCASHSLCL